MLTLAFWRAVAERALRTIAQALLSFLFVGHVLSVLDVSWGQALGVAGGAALFSVLTSIVSYSATGSASLGAEQLVPEPPDRGRHEEA